MTLAPEDDFEIPEDPLAMRIDLADEAFAEAANRYCASFIGSIRSPRDARNRRAR